MIQAIPPAEDRCAIDITFAYQKGGQVMNLVVPLSTLVPHPPSPESEAPEGALEDDSKDDPDGFTVTLANVSTTGFESLQLAWVALGR